MVYEQVLIHIVEFIIELFAWCIWYILSSWIFISMTLIFSGVVFFPSLCILCVLCFCVSYFNKAVLFESSANCWLFLCCFYPCTNCLLFSMCYPYTNRLLFLFCYLYPCTNCLLFFPLSMHKPSAVFVLLFFPYPYTNRLCSVRLFCVFWVWVFLCVVFFHIHTCCCELFQLISWRLYI